MLFRPEESLLEEMQASTATPRRGPKVIAAREKHTLRSKTASEEAYITQYLNASCKEHSRRETVLIPPLMQRTRQNV